jgi:hypothetical protein
MRGGRVDATAAGPIGVPQPQIRKGLSKTSSRGWDSMRRTRSK